MTYHVDYARLRQALDILLPGTPIDFATSLGLRNPGLGFLRFGAGIGRITPAAVIALELERMTAGERLTAWETEFALALSTQVDDLAHAYLTPTEAVADEVFLGWRLAAVAAALGRPRRDDEAFEIASFLASWCDQSGLGSHPGEWGVTADPARPRAYLSELAAIVAERRGVDLDARRA